MDVLYPDQSKSVKENTEELGVRDYTLKKDCYESVYGKVLTYDFENSGTRGGNLESASYSVINIKKVKIFFEGDYTKGDVFKKYFYASINPYLKQVIPSTTIYELSFLSDNTEETKLKLASAVGITDSSELNTYEHNS